MKHRVRYWLNGKRTQRTFSKKSDADRFKAEIKRRKEAFKAGIAYIDETMTMEEAYRVWINSRIDKRPESTWSADMQRFQKYILPKFGKVSFTKIRTAQWQEFLDDLTKQLSNSTVNRVRSLLSKFYNDLKKLEKVEYNPIAATDRLTEPKQHNVEGYFKTDKDIEEYLNRMRERGFLTFGLLMVYLGLRPSEALALHWSDIDFASNRVFVRRIIEQVSGKYVLRTKGKKSRIVPLFPEVKNSLRQMRPKSGFIVKKDGESVGLDRGKRNHRAAVMNWREDVTPKGLRVTFAYRMNKLGFSPQDIQMMLGHTTIITTERYMRSNEQDLVNKMKKLSEITDHKKATFSESVQDISFKKESTNEKK